MSGDTLQAALEREHREIDGGIEAFIAGLKSGERAAAPLRQTLDALRRHIYLEEEFLFPPLRKTGLMVPILVMLREHGELWRSMNRLEESLAADAGNDALTRACGELLALQETHNAKEEPVIYPSADTKLDTETTAKLAEFLKIGVLPKGWVCSTARESD